MSEEEGISEEQYVDAITENLPTSDLHYPAQEVVPPQDVSYYPGSRSVRRSWSPNWSRSRPAYNPQGNWSAIWGPWENAPRWAYDLRDIVVASTPFILGSLYFSRPGMLPGRKATFRAIRDLAYYGATNEPGYRGLNVPGQDYWRMRRARYRSLPFQYLSSQLLRQALYAGERAGLVPSYRPRRRINRPYGHGS